MDREELRELIANEMHIRDEYIILKDSTWNELADYIYELEQDRERLKDVEEYINKVKQGLEETPVHIADTEPGIHINTLYLTVNIDEHEEERDETD